MVKKKYCFGTSMETKVWKLTLYQNFLNDTQSRVSLMSTLIDTVK